MSLDYTNKEVTDALIQEIWDLAHEPEEVWSYLGDFNGVNVQKRKYKNHSLQVVRARVTIEFPPDEVRKPHQDISKRPLWDDMMEHGVLLEELSDGGHIHYIIMKPVSVVSSRDFVYYTRLLEKENGVWVSGTSSVSEKYAKSPEFKKGIVRGEIIISGLVAKPVELEGGKIGTSFVCINLVDPKGWLPHAAVNLAAAKGSSAIGFLRNYLKKEHV